MFSSFEISIFFSIPFKLFVFFFFINNMVVMKSMLNDYMKMVGVILMDSLFFIFQVVLVVFMVILFMNVFSLVPYSISFSSLGVSLFFSFSLWAASFFYLMWKYTIHNLSHFLPVSTPMLLVFALVWIEVLSMLARPIALSVRLMANITAGHLLMHLGSSGLFSLSPVISVVIFPVFMALMFLEISVAFIQTYVFSMLISLYTSESSM